MSWAAARQTLIAAHTAESELYSLSEGHLMGKAFRPTVAALMNVDESSIKCHLYCDNMAAVQLCTLEAGSWRTRHLRLRGAIIRQDLESERWALAHLDGVFMPADLGTKPVGPARLEDLLRLCDLWTPHLEHMEDPPRPSVARVQSSPSGFMSTLLALLMIVQVNGVCAWGQDLSGFRWELVGVGFSLGFGLGCGFWLAVKLGQGLEACFRRVRGAVRSSRGRPWVSQSRHHPLQQQPDGPEFPANPNPQAEVIPSRQPNREEAPGVMIPLNDGTLVPLEEATYEDIRDAYYADLREAYVQAGQFDEMPGILREDPEFQRVRDRFGSPRVPTVARPPGYPGLPEGELVVGLDRPVYQIGGVPRDVGEAESSEEESEQVSSTSRSTTSGGARDLQETGSAATSLSRGVSGASHQSAVSRAASLGVALLPQVQGATVTDSEVQTSSWELWVVLSLIVVVSMCAGACGMWAVWKYVDGCRGVSMGHRSDAPVSEDASCENVSTPASQHLQPVQAPSPVINIHVTGSVFGERAEEQSKGLEVQVAAGSGDAVRLDADSARSQTLSVCGLGPGGTLRRRAGRDSNPDSTDPCGLDSGQDRSAVTSRENPGTQPLGPKVFGPSKSKSVPERSAPARGDVSARPLDVGGLVPGNSRPVREHESSKTQDVSTRTLSPKGLGPQGSQVGRRVELDARTSDLSSRPAESTSYAMASSAGMPLDRFRKPWGMKKKEYLSSSGEDPRPFVYLTQFGQCLHSGTTCSPMQSSGFAIQRSICRFCFGSHELPSRQDPSGNDRTVYLTRSGHYVHLSDWCECLDSSDELLTRKLCRCCRWK